MSRSASRLLPVLLLAGACCLPGCGHDPAGHAEHGGAEPPAGAQQVYTCSMHPQVRLDRPGKCPICEMPLIPADAAPAGADGAPSLQLSEQALAMASVETSLVEERELALDLRAVGKVEYNESSLATITARVDGYAERLFVNFTGIELGAGDHLAEVYSPELLVAQQELLIALQSSAGDRIGPMVEASKLKLRRLGLSAEQIRELVEDEVIAERVTLVAPIAGTVIEKSIVQNSAFRAGDALYRVANLDTVWVYLEIYEYDLAWIRYGQPVTLAAEALPGREFPGLVTFVQPVVNEATRTVRVPVHVENPDHALKPGMFVRATIRAALDAEGRPAPTGVEGRYSCPMHPQVLLDADGACPVCEMPLERIPDPPRAGSRLLVVPASAVLDSGTRQIVYVETERGLFEPREVALGPRAGASFPVLRGLAAGERVVTRGGFLIDSQFQITGHPSLFYPGGLAGPPPSAAAAGEHAH